MGKYLAIVLIVLLAFKVHAQSSLNHRNKSFDSYANFSNQEIQVPADFGNTSFLSAVSFGNTNFDQPTGFENARFEAFANFGQTHFAKVGFENATFYRAANFQKAIFDGYSDFSRTNFKSRVDFSRTTFFQDANFNHTKFDSIADFTYIKFDKTAFFQDARFTDKVNFNLALFNNRVDFNLAVLPDTLIFTNVTSNYLIDLSYARNQNNETVINLFETDLDYLNLNYTNFRLFFDPKDSVKDEQVIKIYETLLNRQQEQGYINGFKKLDIEYKAHLYNLTGKWYWNYLQRYWWNYGYNKEWIFLWTIGLLFGFTFFNWILFRYLNENLYKIESVWEGHTQQLLKIDEKHKNPALVQRLSALRFSFYYTCIIFFGFKLSFAHINFKQTWGIIYLVLMFLSGVTCTIYIFNFVFES